MKVCLLYADKEWKGIRPYYDCESIVNDLGLEVLFQVAERDQEERTGTVRTAIWERR